MIGATAVSVKTARRKSISASTKFDREAFIKTINTSNRSSAQLKKPGLRNFTSALSPSQVHKKQNPRLARAHSNASIFISGSERFSGSKGGQSILNGLKGIHKVTQHELPYQSYVKAFYDSDGCQIAVALIIFINFMLSALGATPLKKEHPFVFDVFEIIFCLIFGMELGINQYANWLWAFWEDLWNIFDFVVVVISFLSMSSDNIPGIGVLRLFRAFRVFRLFKRVQSLKNIIEGVVRSLPDVGNAFCILLLLMCIWAIMGVQIFEGTPAEREYKSFMRAVFTMFQISTLDNWGELSEKTYEEYPLTTYVFYFSYVFLCSIVMINVVVAVLIENFLKRDPEEEIEFEEYELEEHDLMYQASKRQMTDFSEETKEMMNSVIVPSAPRGRQASIYKNLKHVGPRASRVSIHQSKNTNRKITEITSDRIDKSDKIINLTQKLTIKLDDSLKEFSLTAKNIDLRLTFLEEEIMSLKKNQTHQIGTELNTKMNKRTKTINFENNDIKIPRPPPDYDPPPVEVLKPQFESNEKLERRNSCSRSFGRF